MAVEPPVYQEPSEQYQEIWDLLMQQYQDFPSMDVDIEQPTGFLPMIAEQIPIERIISFAMNQIGGKGIPGRVDPYRERMQAGVERTFSDIYDVGRAEEAATGGRGSSFAAAKRMQGREAYAGATRGVETEAQRYEDFLRGTGRQTGMGVLGALESAKRGDVGAQQQYEQLLIQALYPQIAGWGAETGLLQGMAGMDAQQQAAFNQFMMQQYGIESGAGGGGGGINFMDIISMIPGIGDAWDVLKEMFG